MAGPEERAAGVVQLPSGACALSYASPFAASRGVTIFPGGSSPRRGGKGFKGSFDKSSAVGMLDFQSDLRPRGIELAELIRLLVVLHDARPFGTAGALRRPPFLEHSLPAIFFEQFVDQRHIGVDYRMAEALLPGDQLYQLVGTFDIRSAVEQRARGRRRAR